MWLSTTSHQYARNSAALQGNQIEQDSHYQIEACNYTSRPQRRHTKAKMSARTDIEAEQNQMSSGITPDTLSATLKEKLDAVHVDIADLSGTGCTSTVGQEVLIDRRRLRSNVRSHHRVASIRKEDYTRETSIGQQHAQAGDRYDTRLDTEMLYA